MKGKILALLVIGLVLSGCGKSVAVSHSTAAVFTENEEDIVDKHGEVANFERMEEFLSNIEWQSEDQIRIVHYTLEGDPIIQEVDFDGEIFTYVYDNTHDNFGSPEVTTSTCTELKTKEDSGMTNYVLLGCDLEYEPLLLRIEGYDGR